MANEGGSGFSGRRIPQQAFQGALSEISFWMVHDMDCQVFRPLVKKNFGIEPQYEIQPFGLADVEGMARDDVSLNTDQIPHESDQYTAAV